MRVGEARECDRVGARLCERGGKVGICGCDICKGQPLTQAQLLSGARTPRERKTPPRDRVITYGDASSSSETTADASAAGSRAVTVTRSAVNHADKKKSGSKRYLAMCFVIKCL